MSECIVGGGSLLAKGYRKVYYNGRYWRAHRLAWSLVHGDIPPGAVVCHKCDNPPCVNVEHLFVGSIADNVQDRTLKGRSASQEQHGSAKLSLACVAFIRGCYGFSGKELARMFGVSDMAIYRVLNNKTWVGV